MERVPLAAIALVLAAGGAAAEERPPVPAAPFTKLGLPDTGASPEVATSPTEGVPPAIPTGDTIDLGGAVRLALEQNFPLLDSKAAVTAARWLESSVRGQFLPQVTPRLERGDGRTVLGLGVSQKLPWTGGTLVASGQSISEPDSDLEAPYPRTTDLRLLVSQPLLRGAGPNATFFDLRNARRAVASRERSFELARQRLAVEVAAAFYSVVAQRELFDVADQSLRRTQALLEASNARLEVGMASKLDVFRAEVQAAQAREGMIHSRAGLETALERFRGILALPPDNPLEPEDVALERTPEGLAAPLEELVSRALDNRLELAEARDRIADARRASALARQNLLPQVDLNLSVTRLGFGRTLNEAWRTSDRQVEVFLSASYPFRRTTEKANRAVSEIEVRTRERGLQQLELEIAREVHEAARELDRIRQSMQVQQQAVAVAEKQRRLAVLRYQRGLASNFDVVDAEGSYVAARSALVGLLTSYAVARLELLRVTGTLSVDEEFAP